METKEIIQALRTKQGLSQNELAERVHVTRQAVSRWENGETMPNVETLKLLSKELDASINTLLGAPRTLVCQCCGMPLQVVLCRRAVCLCRQGVASGFSGGPHAQPGEYGGGCPPRAVRRISVYAEALEGRIKKYRMA